MCKKYSDISFCTENYKESNPDMPYEETINEYEMISDISDFIRLCIKNGYQMKIWYDGMTVVIEYNYQDESLSGVSLEWVGENEYVETYDDKCCEVEPEV